MSGKFEKHSKIGSVSEFMIPKLWNLNPHPLKIAKGAAPDWIEPPPDYLESLTAGSIRTDVEEFRRCRLHSFPFLIVKRNIV
jgi:hypothetical protein